ncbi:PREDICTED: uncharacterized protein LOC104780165 [Camelina sativa]|uniref:Uncharacterized protein LOC104780165 n=1 Tax=Camelina sativa TaxID=90675 RepID=A0ABM0YLS9_CAMSA|nr:PREDICTED: uncharacterized protein LOC104780165 [Camelina sativa]
MFLSPSRNFLFPALESCIFSFFPSPWVFVGLGLRLKRFSVCDSSGLIVEYLCLLCQLNRLCVCIAGHYCSSSSQNFLIGMASSSEVSKYPPPLYVDGKSPLQSRSMNHNCFLSKIGPLKEGLGSDVWESLEKSSLGVFLKLTELSYTWCAKNVHYLLTHQLRVNNFHEVWSLIDDRPIRFYLNEFAHITGLNCDPFDVSDHFEADHHEFWAKMKLEKNTEGPKFNELLKVVDFCKTWSPEERTMVGRLCLLSVCVHGLHSGSSIPLASAKRVLDPVAFEKYPWGRVAFTSLVNSLKTVAFDKSSYTIQRCVHALLIWLYESVPGVGEACGLRRLESAGVPLLNWQSSRKHINFKEFIEKEKKEHGQVRVRHMLPVSEDDLYPTWCDADDNKDPDLENLIEDIFHNRLRDNAWEGFKTVNVRKNKRKVEAGKDGEIRSSQKEKKLKEAHSYDDEQAEVPDMKEKLCKEHIQDVRSDQKTLLDIWKLLEKLNGSITELDKNLSNRMTCLETKFESFLKESKEAKTCAQPKEATSDNKGDDEVHSKALSWIVEMKETTNDEFPVPRVVRKVYTVKNKKERREDDQSEDLSLCEMKDATKGKEKSSLAKVAVKSAIKVEKMKSVDVLDGSKEEKQKKVPKVGKKKRK